LTAIIATAERTLLLDAYRRMRLIRAFEERIRVEFENGNIPGFVHLYVGQEASAVGVCIGLAKNDYIGSTHRGHGHCIAKGCDIRAMMAEIFGRRTGLCGGKGGSMHIADFTKGMLGANAIVGGNPPLVIGAALSAKTLGTGGVAVSFTGDGGANQGTTLESMNMAVVLKLPAIFVFENNGFGEMTACEYAIGSRDIAGRAAAFGMPATKVDGTDFFAVLEAARAAINLARNGGGPSAIETVATRWHGHYIGDAQLYRSKTERESTRAIDPLLKFKTRCADAGAISSEELSLIDSEISKLIDDAVASAGAAPAPEPDELTRDVYCTY
jgi:TPP-dependent pyruvate/acetoin dehydrogenase alpha subunit